MAEKKPSKAEIKKILEARAKADTRDAERIYGNRAKKSGKSK